MERRAGSSPKGSARREEILRTAMRMLEDGEHRVTTLRAIGRELGVEPAQILYYFPSLEHLLTAVVERWDEESMQPGPPDGGSVLDLLGRSVRRNLRLPGIVRIYLSLAADATDPRHPAHEFFLDRFARAHRDLANAVRAEQTRGTIDADLDADDIADRLVALADGLQLQALYDPAVDAASAVDAAVDALRSADARTAQRAPS